MRRLTVAAAALLCAVQAAGERSPSRPVLLAYARHYQFEMLVGQFDAKNKFPWIPNSSPFTPPGYHAAFTLFGPRGRIDRVHVDEDFKMRRDVQPWEWNVAISTWNRSETPFALAVSGLWPNVQHPPAVLAATQEDAVAVVREFLETRQLHVSAPRITQVLSVDMRGDGEQSLVVCANSDNAPLTDGSAAAVYSLALLRTTLHGASTTLPLRAYAFPKSTAQTVDEFNRSHGRPAFYQVLAVTELAGNGQSQISILNDNRREEPEIDVFGLDGDRVVTLLSVRKLIL